MKNLLTYLLAILTFVACSDSGTESGGSGGGGQEIPKQPEITLSTTAADFSTDGGSNVITFTSSEDWTAEVVNSRADEWCSIEPTSGPAGSAKITITTKENDTPDDRTASIIIKAGTASKTINVSQKQKDALTVTSSKFEVSAEGGEITIEVKANINFDFEIAENAEDWITHRSTRALKTSQLVFEIDKNEDTENRKANISISSGNLRETVTIYQEGNEPTIILSDDEFTVSSSKETIAIDVKSNVDVAVEIPNNVNWIKENTSRAFSTNTYYFDIAQNDGYDNRTAEIKFTNKENGIYEKVKITQMQRDAIVIADSEYTFDENGGELDFEIKTNVEFKVSISSDAQSWIKQVDTRGLQSKTLHFDIAANDSDNDREGTITLSGGDAKQTITVIQVVTPSQIIYTSVDGKIVTPNVEAFGNAKIASNVYEYENGRGVITFDRKILKIGQAAFENCWSLKSITLPSGIKSVDADSFRNCYSLAEIMIPEGVTKIGADAFMGCKGLTSIHISDSVTNIEGSFRGCTNLQGIYGKYASADNRCWIMNGKLMAFASAGLSQYTIPNGVLEIGTLAFGGCENMVHIWMPNSVQEIGTLAFTECKSLTDITIPNSVKEIGNGAFWYCISLNSFNGKFVSEDRRSVVVDGNLLAFAPEGLSAYTIPNGVSKIGTGVFEQCVNLTSVIIPYGVIVIGEWAFFRCVSLKNVYMPESISMIKSMAFRNCSNLARINIPKSVVEISSYVFDGCSNLEIINSISNKPPTMGINVFEECNKLKVVNVPHESISKYKSASGWSMYADKIVGCEFFGDCAGTEVPNNQIWYTSADESVVQTMKSAFGAAIVSNVYENGRGVITCDRDIQIVGKEAFGRSPLLLGVALPESVTTIDANAFAYTSLKSITIPNGVTSIGLMAFAECRDLRSFYGKYASEDNRSLIMDGCLIAFAPAGLTYYSTPPGTTKIGDAAFWGCSNLGGIGMGENVKEIGAGAFYGCSSLESFHLPQFVMKVGARAFAYCGGLEYITIDEYAIEIGNEAFLKCGNLTEVHCRPANPPSIGRKVFELCDKLRRIEVPHKSIDSYKTASGWSEYADKIDGDV